MINLLLCAKCPSCSTLTALLLIVLLSLTLQSCALNCSNLNSTPFCLATARPRLFGWTLSWKNNPELLYYVSRSLHIVDCRLVDRPWAARAQAQQGDSICLSLASGWWWSSPLLWASLQGEQESQRLLLPAGLGARQRGCREGRKQEGIWAGACPAPALVFPAPWLETAMPVSTAVNLASSTLLKVTF